MPNDLHLVMLHSVDITGMPALFLKGNTGTVDLGDREMGAMTGKRGDCGLDVLYKRRINLIN